MKEHIKKIAKNYGCEARYSGRNKVMWIHGERSEEFVNAIKPYYLPFMVYVSPKMWMKGTISLTH